MKKLIANLFETYEITIRNRVKKFQLWRENYLLILNVVFTVISIILIHNNHADYVIDMFLGYSAFSLIALILNLIEFYACKKTENLGMATIDSITKKLDTEINNSN